MPSLSAAILPRQFHSMGVIEDNLSFPSSSTSQHPLVSIETQFEEGLGSDSDTDSSASSLNLFGEWHVNSPRPVAMEENEGASQVLLIPHTSPFFNTPSRTTSGSDYSSPSVCPTLSGKFDLVQSAPNTPSGTTIVRRFSKRDQIVSSGLLQRRRARINQVPSCGCDAT